MRADADAARQVVLGEARERLDAVQVDILALDDSMKSRSI
jgi:hypothetical protein